MVATILLSSCAQFAFLVSAEGLEFELAGRIAVSYRDDAGSGNIAWRHGARGDELLLTTPFGQGIARLARTGDEITLTAQDGREFRAADAESLTERVLGFRLPLIGLADWVRGKPSPALEARGWTIEYQEHDAERRPILMRLTYPGIELRLAVSEWK